MNDTEQRLVEHLQRRAAAVDPHPDVEDVRNRTVPLLEPRTSPLRRSRVLLTASLLAVTTTGITLLLISTRQSQPSPSDSTIVSGTSPDPSTDATLTLNDLPYELPLTDLSVRPPEDAARIFVRSQSLIGECMNERGFDYPHVEYQPSSSPAPRVDSPFGFWLASESGGGYQRPRDPRRSGPDPVEQYADRLPKATRRAWSLALHGTSHGGPPLDATLVDGTVVETGHNKQFMKSCMGTAFNGLHDNRWIRYSAYQQTISSYLGEASDRSYADRRVTAAVDSWSTCMADAGYDYDNPNQPFDQYAGNGSSAEEDTIFTADLGCKQQANLFAAWFTAKSEHESALADEHHDVIEQFRRLRNIPLAPDSIRPTSSGAGLGQIISPDTASQLATTFLGRYGVDAEQVTVASVSRDVYEAVVGQPLVTSDDPAALAFAIGDLTDSGAHPPAGAEPPKGRTAFVLIGSDGLVIEGGLMRRELATTDFPDSAPLSTLLP